MVPMFISFVCNSTATVIHIGAVFPATNSTSGSVNPMYTQLITASFMAIRDLNSLYATDRKILFKLAVRDSTTTFEGTVAATVEIATRTFGVNGTNIIIGGGSDRETTEGMSTLLKYTDIPQIYAASDLSSLEPSDYENLSRVYPPSSSEGSTLATVLSSYFSYSRVVLIHSTDVYGLAGSDKFISSAEDLGIEILMDCSIGSLADIDDCFESLKNSDPRVFVLIISSLETAGAILSNGTIAGIFNQDSIIFGSGSLSTTSLWSQLSLQPLAMTKLIASFFTISFANDDWKVSIRGKSFIKNFRSQANTVVILPNGTKICSDRTDDDGHYKLFQITPYGKSQYVCVGKIYSSFAVDGSDITSYTSYVYDAIWAAGIAVIKYADTFSNGVIPTNVKLFNGKKFGQGKVEFLGYSGNVSFTTGKHHRGGFSHTGLRYKISNFHIGNGTLSSITLQRVGTSTEDGIFSKCTSDTELQSFVTGGCSELRYGNVYNIQPSDRAHNIIQRLPVAMRNTLYVMAGIDFVVIIFFGVILVIYRHSRILRAAQPAMMWIILSSNLYLVVRIIMSSGISNSFVCVCNAWTGHLGE